VNGLTILNTNDCGIRNLYEAKYIKDIVGDIDILLTQFSYAYWAGNKDDIAYRQKIAADKLMFMKLQCDYFKPKVTIPIASYVYFCHEENFYLNDSVNTPEKTYNFLKNNTITTPVVLYNGDEYTFEQGWDSKRSISKYLNDFEEIKKNQNKLVKNNKVAINELFNAADRFIQNLKNTNGIIIKSILKPAKIHLLDYDKTYTLSLNKKLEEISIDYRLCDVSLSSESLLFCLKYPYGLDTTQINGRLQKPKGGNYARFYNLFRIDQQKSRGQDITLGYLFKAGVRKVKVKLGLLKN
jgi:hypothetical protein